MRIMIAVVLAVLACAPAGPALAADGPRRVHARSAYLAEDGRTRWARRPDTRRPVASITKVMTAVVVLRAGHLDRRVRVQRRHLAYCAALHGSTARLRPGDRIPVRELLNAMLLPSGCDAAVALAERYGPGQARFVAKMNRTARRLGMRRTGYRDATGLTGLGTSTARDQVTLGRYALGLPEFRRIVGRPEHVLRAGRGHGRYVWRSTDVLLGSYPGMLGIKSGHTAGAGQCFLFAARRRGRTLVGIVLGSTGKRRDARFQDTMRMLDWGFRH
ncbi:D-alanyl-D-alanine carboxypeptidase family protein [Actinomadura macrotermitis]|uniref:D-alanyl-D-alanine carboxypeptidase n=1 Tax=Actinomadura macrotermitis TaxID=2585200 RepID=A0A7K0BVY7_9ACTN|nr:serine hydrolase [Actinomadura macrotermitis]MQY05331.1 D-alanyl-D-alanine carboxypeptidase [Actinomadura macrotermitis]